MAAIGIEGVGGGELTTILDVVPEVHPDELVTV